MSHQSGYWPLLTPPASSDSARGRRAEASSSGSTSSGSFFGISCTKYRVGAPPLRPLPITTVREPAHLPLFARFESEFKERAEDILARNGIVYPDYECGFVTRCIPGEIWTAEPTIIIIAEWTQESPNTWVRVVGELKAWIDDRLHETGDDKEGVTVAVEMIAHQLNERKSIAPVLNKPDLERDWPSILDSVYRILESFEQTRSRMTSISLFRLGFSLAIEENPITVYVSVDYDCPESTWPPVIRAIESYIEGTTHDLHVHMEHNSPQYWSFPLLPPTVNDQEAKYPGDKQGRLIKENYRATVDMGAEIGPCRYITRDGGKQCNPGYGTLGCYVEIKTKQKQQWAKFGLTNYHVVRSALEGYRFKPIVPKPVKNLDQRAMSSCFTTEQIDTITISKLDDPPQGSDLWRSDRDGFNPTAREPRYPMEHPSRVCHNYTVHQEQRHVASLQAEGPSSRTIAKTKAQQLNQKIAFFDDDRQWLGRIWAGSGWGRRTPQNNRLDWALIEVEGNRLGRNALPGYDTWEELYESEYIPGGAGRTGLLKPQTKMSAKGAVPGTNAYKVGARTGATAGCISHYQSRVRLKQDSYMNATFSDEWVYIGHPNLPGIDFRPFGNHGDSGAVVYNSQGEVLGQLFAGQKPQQTYPEGLAYVTRIEDLFKDIKDFSEGQITGIRIAMS